MRKALTAIFATTVALLPVRAFGVWLEGQRPVFTGKIAAVFDTPGTYTWTVPDGVWRIMVEMWGGGARGSFSSDIVTLITIGAGGGYGFASIDVTPGMTCTIVVGRGGTSEYDPGGTTSITCGSTSYYAEGGHGPWTPCIGGSANTPFSIHGQGCGFYDSARYRETEGGSAPRGGFGTTGSGIWPGGGGGSGSGAPGGLVIYY